MDVTSSEISALFGVCPYINGNPQRWAEFLAEKRTGIPRLVVQTDAMEMGLEVEEAIARMAARRWGWKLRKMEEYIRDPARRQGASFDREILLPENGLGEIKMVGGDGYRWNQGWSTRNGIVVRIPPHIRLQVQHQMKLARKPFAHVIVLRIQDMKVFRTDKIFADFDTHRQIDQKVDQFWTALAAKEPPAPIPMYTAAPTCGTLSLETA